jgi:hypothetical protein
MAILVYHQANGFYPKHETDLLDGNPPYLPQSCNNLEFDGYKYSIEFYQNGYKITTQPTECGHTGDKIFILEDTKGQGLTLYNTPGASMAPLEITKSDCNNT